MKKIFWISPFDSRSLGREEIKRVQLLMDAMFKQDIQLITIYCGAYSIPKKENNIKNLKEELVQRCEDYMDEVARIVDEIFGDGSYRNSYEEYVDSSATFLPIYDYDNENYPRQLETQEILEKLDEIIGAPSDDVKVINAFCYLENDDKEKEYDFTLSAAIHNHIKNVRKGKCVTVNEILRDYKANEWRDFYNKEYPENPVPENFRFVWNKEIDYCLKNSEKIENAIISMQAIMNF